MIGKKGYSFLWMTMDDKAWQWIGNIYLLTWGLIWACACSLEVWCHILGFLLLLYFHYLNWPILKTFEDYVNIAWTKFFSVNFHQRGFNVDIWLKMKVEPMYIYWRCLNVGKQYWNNVTRITSIQRRRWSNVISKLKFDWKWKLSRRIFIDVVSTLTKQPWINVKIITSIQCWWLNAFLTLIFGSKGKLSQRMFIGVASTLRKQHWNNFFNICCTDDS